MHCIIGYENFKGKKWYFIEVPDTDDEAWKSMNLEIHTRRTMLGLNVESKLLSDTVEPNLFELYYDMNISIGEYEFNV